MRSVRLEQISQSLVVDCVAGQREANVLGDVIVAEADRDRTIDRDQPVLPQRRPDHPYQCFAGALKCDFALFHLINRATVRGSLARITT
jgi:hypothetical protein